MNNKEIFENYLTSHYSKCEKTDFAKNSEVESLLKKNYKPIERNLGLFFKKNIKKDYSILDLGCGYGSFLYFLQSFGYKRVTGVDISSEEIDICRRFFSSYRLHKEDIFDYMRNTQEKFDVVYLSHVLEHIKKENLFDFLKGVRNTLTDNGYFVVIAPNSAAYFNSSANRYGDLTHEIGFTNLSLNQMFMVAGFKNIKVRNFFGVGNLGLNIARKMALFFFEMFIQVLGYDKQEIHTPSISVIAKK